MQFKVNRNQISTAPVDDNRVNLNFSVKHFKYLHQMEIGNFKCEKTKNELIPQGYLKIENSLPHPMLTRNVNLNLNFPICAWLSGMVVEE